VDSLFLPLASAKLAFLNGAESSSLAIASAIQAAQIQVVHAAQIQTLKAHHDEELPFVMLLFAILLVLMLVFMPGPPARETARRATEALRPGGHRSWHRHVCLAHRERGPARAEQGPMVACPDSVGRVCGRIAGRERTF